MGSYQRGLVAILLIATVLIAIPTTPSRAQQPAAPAAPAQATAPTYTVFATREGLVGHRTANGYKIRPRDRFVALPSWSVLSSKGGNEFQVRVTYKGRSVVLPVWDVGPWNTNDDYWSPKRRYSDLPVGMPMAQAAYERGYNKGRDSFGRKIRMPNGIDIADGAFWDDLGMKESDWVQVTFLWLGNDPAASKPEEPVRDNLGIIEPNAVLIDDGGPGYTPLAGGAWYDAPCGAGGRYSWTYAAANQDEGENSARWMPKLPQPGFYEAYAFIPSCGRDATQAARYRVTHEGAITDVVVNQRSNAGKWVSLGVYHMDSDTGMVELSDVTGEKDAVSVRFDAVRFVPRTDTVPPEARVTEAIRRGDGSILVRWTGKDDVAGIAGFDIQYRLLPDGAWSEWINGGTTTEAIFTPPQPGGYAFRARARDWASNQQPWREADDASVAP